MVGGVVTLPDIQTPDLRLLSPWAIIATVLALTALWRLVHNSFQLGVLARAPKWGRLSVSDGRSPTVIAGHFTSVANAVVCLAAFAPAAQQRLAADGYSLGAVFPLWSRPLAMAPPTPGIGLFFLSLSAYCLHAALIAAERIMAGASSEHLALFQRLLLFILAASVCMVESVPQLALALLLLEVPSPLVGLWQSLQDFRARSDNGFAAAGVVAVFGIVKCRLVLFGLCVMIAIHHPDAKKKFEASAQRFIFMLLCFVLFTCYLVDSVYFSRDVRRASQDAKQLAGRDPRSSSNMQV